MKTDALNKPYSSDPTVATVEVAPDGSLVITALKAGTCRIIVPPHMVVQLHPGGPVMTEIPVTVAEPSNG